MKTKRTLLNYITDIVPLMIVSVLGISIILIRKNKIKNK